MLSWGDQSTASLRECPGLLQLGQARLVPTSRKAVYRDCIPNRSPEVHPDPWSIPSAPSLISSWLPYFCQKIQSTWGLFTRDLPACFLSHPCSLWIAKPGAVIQGPLGFFPSICPLWLFCSPGHCHCPPGIIIFLADLALLHSLSLVSGPQSLYLLGVWNEWRCSGSPQVCSETYRATHFPTGDWELLLK